MRWRCTGAEEDGKELGFVRIEEDGDAHRCRPWLTTNMYGGVGAAVMVRGGQAVCYGRAAADIAFTRQGLAGAAGCRGSQAERTCSHAGLKSDLSIQGAVKRESKIRNKNGETRSRNKKEECLTACFPLPLPCATSL